MTEHYNELCKPINAGMPDYPEVCPVCGSEVVDSDCDGYHGPKYECGGQYKYKPQIQNHTSKWWGKCPKVYMEKINAMTLTDESTSQVWVVRKDGTRFHIATFTNGCVSESFARELSKDYPLFWNDGAGVDYVEITGQVGFGDSGIRYQNGEVIARKAYPYHINGEKFEKVWFKVYQLSLGHYKSGEILK
jgi:hypothetical protein